jgi:hypothetical protein
MLMGLQTAPNAPKAQSMTHTKTNSPEPFDNDQIAPLKNMRERRPDSPPQPHWWNRRGERRMGERVPASDQGHIRILTPVSAVTSTVQLVNRSTYGMRIKGANSVYPGTLVQIRLKDTLLIGEVRYCTDGLEGGFAFGIRVECSTTLKPETISMRTEDRERNEHQTVN